MPGGSPGSRRLNISAAVETLEKCLLSLLLLSILVLASADVVMRNLFNSGLEIAGPAVRLLVLWLGLLSAVYATGQSKHISIDIAGSTLKPSVAKWV